MKKTNIFTNVVSILLVAMMSVFLLAGCSKKKSTTNDNYEPNFGNSTENSNSQANGQFDPTQMKQKMEDGLKELVTAGTITQAQSDKILTALSNSPAFNGQGFSGQRRNQGTQQGNTQGNQQGTQQNGQQNNQQASGQGKGQATQGSGQNNSTNGQTAPGNGQQGTNPNGGQNRQFANPLSQLVTDGVITQAQADAVMQKVYGNMGRPANGQRQNGSGQNGQRQNNNSGQTQQQKSTQQQSSNGSV